MPETSANRSRACARAATRSKPIYSRHRGAVNPENRNAPTSLCSAAGGQGGVIMKPRGKTRRTATDRVTLPLREKRDEERTNARSIGFAARQHFSGRTAKIEPQKCPYCRRQKRPNADCYFHCGREDDLEHRADLLRTVYKLVVC